MKKHEIGRPLYLTKVSKDYNPESVLTVTDSGLVSKTPIASLASTITKQPSASTTSSGTDGVRIEKGGTEIGTQGGINFIEGSNITLTITNVPASDRVNVQIDASGGASNDYVDGVSFNTTNGNLTLTRTGALPDITENLDGRYALIGAFDNYNNWVLEDDAGLNVQILSGNKVKFIEGPSGDISIAYANGGTYEGITIDFINSSGYLTAVPQHDLLGTEHGDASIGLTPAQGQVVVNVSGTVDPAWENVPLFSQVGEGLSTASAEWAYTTTPSKRLQSGMLSVNWGGSGGFFGSATTVARSDHSHNYDNYNNWVLEDDAGLNVQILSGNKVKFLEGPSGDISIAYANGGTYEGVTIDFINNSNYLTAIPQHDLLGTEHGDASIGLTPSQGQVVVNVSGTVDPAWENVPLFSQVGEGLSTASAEWAYTISPSKRLQSGMLSVNWGGSGGFFGSATTVARSDHSHDYDKYEYWTLADVATPTAQEVNINPTDKVTFISNNPNITVDVATPSKTVEINWTNSSGYITSASIPSELSDLSDVNVAVGIDSANNDLLQFNTSTNEWYPVSYSEAGVAEAVHNHSASQITSGTFLDARISQSSVTQHQAALSIGWGQLTGVPTYDNYNNWVVSDGSNTEQVVSGNTVKFVPAAADINMTVTYDNGSNEVRFLWSNAQGFVTSASAGDHDILSHQDAAATGVPAIGEVLVNTTSPDPNWTNAGLEIAVGNGLTGSGAFTYSSNTLTSPSIAVSWGGSGGNFGTANTVSRSDHLHDGRYALLAHTHSIYESVGSAGAVQLSDGAGSFTATDDLLLSGRNLSFSGNATNEEPTFTMSSDTTADYYPYIEWKKGTVRGMYMGWESNSSGVSTQNGGYATLTLDNSEGFIFRTTSHMLFRTNLSATDPYWDLGRVRGIGFTWNGTSNYGDVGTTRYHGLFSTDTADAYSDDMSLNSFGDVNIRIDSNNNGAATPNDNKINFYKNTVAATSRLGYIDEGGGLYMIGEVESYDTSDIRVKDLKGDLDTKKALENIINWRTVEYHHKRKDTDEIGLIAQDVFASYGDLLTREGVQDGMLQINYGRTNAVIIAAIKEVVKRIEKLENGRTTV